MDDDHMAELARRARSLKALTKRNEARIENVIVEDALGQGPVVLTDLLGQRNDFTARRQNLFLEASALYGGEDQQVEHHAEHQEPPAEHQEPPVNHEEPPVNHEEPPAEQHLDELALMLLDLEELSDGEEEPNAEPLAAENPEEEQLVEGAEEQEPPIQPPEEEEHLVEVAVVQEPAAEHQEPAAENHDELPLDDEEEAAQILADDLLIDPEDPNAQPLAAENPQEAAQSHVTTEMGKRRRLR